MQGTMSPDSLGTLALWVLGDLASGIRTRSRRKPNQSLRDIDLDLKLDSSLTHCMSFDQISNLCEFQFLFSYLCNTNVPISFTGYMLN